VLFNSPTFIFLFLPCVVACGLALRSRSGVGTGFLAFMVVASLAFYSYTNPWWLPLIVGSILCNYGLGEGIRRGGGWRRPLLICGVAFNLALLGYYKYADFFILNVNALTDAGIGRLGVILPIGISFYTFQQIAYLVDVYRGQAGRPAFLEYVFFVSFFPQLIAGPIVHHAEIIPQLRACGRTERMVDDLATGLTIFFIGLAKKLLLADTFALHATPVFAAADAGVQVTTTDAWVGTLAYGLQIYFDFSGYSDMAIGLARMFGLRLPVNFDSPYKSTSIIDFWRRWHITLSRFLKDYLYIPLGGNRLGAPRRFANLLVTMLLGGLWHGAGWGFVLWGALHGAYLCVNHAFRAIRGPRTLTRIERVGAAGLTFLAVMLAWVPFRAETLNGALNVWAGLAGLSGADPGSVLSRPFTLPLGAGLLVAFLAPNSQQIARHLFADRRVAPHSNLLRPVGALAAGTAACAGMLINNRVAEFLYFQF